MAATRLSRLRDLLFVGVTSLCLLCVAGRCRSAENPLRQDLEAFTQVLVSLQSYHVVKPDDHALVGAAIAGMTASLGPESRWAPADSADVTSGSDRAEIGVVFGSGRGSIVLSSVTAGGPAALAGLRPGDRIVSVNGVRMPRSTVREAHALLTGTTGAVVDVVIDNDDAAGPFHAEIALEKLPAAHDVAAFLLRPGVGYARLARCSPSATSELQLAMVALQRQGMRQLVLDLRGNPGGVLTDAVEVLELFVPEGRPLLSTRGRIESAKADYQSRDRTGKWTDGPLVVLTDHWTSSGAEAVAGALQENDRALVAGAITFGNGAVSNAVRIPQGVLYCTVAAIHLPSGRPIQREYTRFEERADRLERLSRERVSDPAEIEALPQFKSRSGRVVRGGGGVCPDVLLPAPPADSRLIREMQARHVFEAFATRLARSQKSPPEGTQIALSPDDWQELRRLVTSRSIAVSDAEWDSDRGSMLLPIQMELARQRSAPAEHLRIAVEGDPQVRAALDLLPRAAELLAGQGGR